MLHLNLIVRLSQISMLLPLSCTCGLGFLSGKTGYFKFRFTMEVVVMLTDFLNLYQFLELINSTFLLRKIALPYPHKCLFGFVEQNVSTDKNFLRNILVTRGDPFVCACPRLRSSRCRQTIVESSSLYFWSIWEQHVFFLIIVHSRMKIYEVFEACKRAPTCSCPLFDWYYH